MCAWGGEGPGAELHLQLLSVCGRRLSSPLWQRGSHHQLSFPVCDTTRPSFGERGFLVLGFASHVLACICPRGNFPKQLHVLGPCRQDATDSGKINEMPAVGMQG